MISGKNNSREEGYLLLESLLTLTILMTIILMMCPLVVDWITNQQEAKKLVEESRIQYESSMTLKNSQSNQLEYSIKNKKQIEIKEVGTEVSIYEIIFE